MPVYTVPSQSGDKTYRVAVDDGGHARACTCPHWRYRRPAAGCKHFPHGERLHGRARKVYRRVRERVAAIVPPAGFDEMFEAVRAREGFAPAFRLIARIDQAPSPGAAARAVNELWRRSCRTDSFPNTP